MMDSVCGLPRTYSRPPGFGHSLLVAGSGEGWGGRSPGAGGKGYRLCRSAMNRNRPFRDGHHIGPSHRAICCRRSDGFEAAARTVALTRMNGGKLAYASPGRLALPHRSWQASEHGATGSSGRYWGQAIVSVDDRVATWLDEIGLGQYATVFAENAVDLEVLPDVTETDLERLGVALDRKSTRLNSSHLGNSYAVFRLKKKSKTHN